MSMKEITSQSPSFLMSDCVRTYCLLLCCAILISGGCAERKRPALSWSTAVLVRPIVPPSTVAENPEPVPDLRLEFPPQPVRLAVAHNGPARPHSATPPAPENAATAKPETPLIVPQLSPEESKALQDQTNQSTNAAVQNLAAVYGKTLNVTQTDLVSKIRSFLADSQEAGRTGDWRRARNLAKKAEVLSQELVGSL
jgi:hypothetical protein